MRFLDLIRPVPAAARVFGGFAVLAALLAPGFSTTGSPEGAEDDVPDFAAEVKPLLEKHCFRCHGPDEQKADVRLDVLDPDMVAGPHAEHWKAMLDMIQGGDMPPWTEPELPDDERRTIIAWVRAGLDAAARAQAGDRHAVIRRLNKEQYSNTLRDLLGIDLDFGRPLPDDGKSEMGFTNNGEVLLSSPLHIDYYRSIARAALEQAIAIGEKPPITRYRVTFGRDIGIGHVAAETGGYQSVKLSANDFLVDILDENGRPMEGAKQPERDALDDIRRTISIGLRGSSMDRFRVVDEGMMMYGARPHVEKVPKAWQGPSPNLKLQMQRSFPERGDLVFRITASEGYLLRKREEVLIEQEDAVPFVALDDANELVLRDGAIALAAANSNEHKNVLLEGGIVRPEKVDQEANAHFRIELEEDSFLQIDMVHPYVSADRMPSTRLKLDGSTLDRRFELPEPAPTTTGEAPVEAAPAELPTEGDANASLEEVAATEVVPGEQDQAAADAETPEPAPETLHVSTLGAVYLERGTHHVRLGGPFFIGFRDVVLTPLPDDHPILPRLASELAPPDVNDERSPALRVFAGTRVDDGMDYLTFEESRTVTAPFGQPETYEFFGRLEDLPIPEPDTGDTEILSGIMLLGFWNDHLVKDPSDPGPPLLVESIEFEAPYFPVWPPESHTRIFFDSPNRGDEELYTREVLGAFLDRAFRRPAEPGEIEPYIELWRTLRGDFESYEESVREVLVAVLCSPHFLFLAVPEGEGVLEGEALATRLAYFLWNSPPDDELRDLARGGRLIHELGNQVDRMLEDPRAERFTRAFAQEWLRIDRHLTIDVNVNVYKDFTRFVKDDMVEETVRFLHHTFVTDAPITTLIDSDFAMLNQNLAEFYGVDGVQGTHFRPVRVTPEQRRGGLLAQGAFLSGHSDGTQAHPIKRAVWLKEKILGDPPAPPPPNVPPLDDEAPEMEGLTLKEQLEAHRDNPSCYDCHAALDPFGVVFERYDAVGRWSDVRTSKERNGEPIDASVILPDGTAVDGVDGIKAYILEERPEAFANSLIEHLYAYALGRDVHFADELELEAIRAQVRAEGDTMRAVLRAIVTSPSFTQH